MSPRNRAMLGIRQAIFAGSPYSPQSLNLSLPRVRTIKEASGGMIGGVGDTANSAVSGATEIGGSAMESAGMMGEKAMHTADTTKKISDQMIVEAEDKVEEKSTHQPTDSSVADVRTREQVYD